MLQENEMFLIERDHLKDGKVFPFQIYIFNLVHRQFYLLLNANRPLTKEIEDFLTDLIAQGGKLAIKRQQKKTFLESTKNTIEQIPDLKENELTPEQKEHLLNKKFYQLKCDTEGELHFQSEFEKAVEFNDFNKIISYTRAEIMSYPISINSTVSSAIFLAKNFMHEDNLQNRISAVSFQFSKLCKITDEESLSDLFVASYLMDLGYALLPLKISQTPPKKLNNKELKLYQKHPLLSFHFLKNQDLDLSERCRKIIFEHHELASGNGYPQSLLENNLEMLSLILSAINHLFEFSEGQVTGNKQALRSTIFSMKNKSITSGLEFDFGDKIYEILVNLLNFETKRKVA